MRNSTLTKLFLFTGALLFTMQSVFSQAEADSAQMNAGYVYDVYYNIVTGAKDTVPRTNWDIGFTTEGFNSNIISNDGADVLVYTYPDGDTSDWATVDTAGLSATWTPQFGSDKDWFPGSFDYNSLGHPDYGWGIYNDISHDVVGDSLFVVKTAAGDWKKLWIVRLISVAKTFVFKYADLDGSNEKTVELVSGDYDTKNFVYYNFSTEEVIDREPAKTDWHLMFTRWASDDYLPAVQKVAGVFVNKSVEVAELRDYVTTGDTCYLDLEFSDEKDAIGYDWKAFSMSTFSYEMVDNLDYFIKTGDGLMYDLTWDAFDYSIAIFKFHKKLINPVAPTAPVIDGSTFAWTPNPMYTDATDYEYITPDDTIACTANPQTIDGVFGIGEVFVRVKADEATCRPAGVKLANDAALNTLFAPKSNQINFAVYPNPAKENINVKLDLNGSVKIQVYNLVGALVFEDVVSNTTNYSIATANFANGMYNLKVQSGNKTGNKMFVVNN